MIYITTDTHFNHKKMIEYCGRPENFEELIKEDMQRVSNGDLLIHLGDICIGKDKESAEFFEYLYGNTVLCKGNHDKKSTQWYMNNGWTLACDKFYMTYKNKRICFSHTPQKDDGSFDINIHGHFHNALPRLLKKQWVVEGEEERNREHLSALTEKHICLALENNKYKIWNLESLIN